MNIVVFFTGFIYICMKQPFQQVYILRRGWAEWLFAIFYSLIFGFINLHISSGIYGAWYWVTKKMTTANGFTNKETEENLSSDQCVEGSFLRMEWMDMNYLLIYQKKTKGKGSYLDGKVPPLASHGTFAQSGETR